MKLNSLQILKLCIALVLLLSRSDSAEVKVNSIDPCENFYEYACRSLRAEVADATMLQQGQYMPLNEDDINLKYASILSKISLDEQSDLGQQPSVRHAVNYYESCLLATNRSLTGYFKLLSQREKLKWPILVSGASYMKTKRMKKPFRQNGAASCRWPRALGILRKYGINNVFLNSQIVPQRAKDKPAHITIETPQLEDYLLIYEEFKLICRFLGLSHELEPKRLDSLWLKFQHFENDLQNLVKSRAGKRIAGPLSAILPTLQQPWLTEYLENMLEFENFNAFSSQIQLVIKHPNYLQALSTMLDMVGLFYGSEFVCGYIKVKFIQYMSAIMPEEFTNVACAAATRRALPNAMQYLYSQQGFDNAYVDNTYFEMDKMFLSFTENLRQEFRDNKYRFSASEATMLKLKASSLRLKLGNYASPDELNGFYQNLSTNSSNFQYNHLNVLLLNERHAQQMLHIDHARHSSLLQNYFEPLLPAESDLSAPHFVAWSGVVIVPITLLHASLFSSSMLVAHEVLHEFDHAHLTLRRNGHQLRSVLRNPSVDRQLSCIDQLQSGINLNDKIADLGGIRLAYNYHFRKPNATTSQPSLNAEEVNKQKRKFFESVAGYYCDSSSNEESSLNFCDTNELRVHDFLANFNEFARVYECRLGSRMNPIQRCQLFDFNKFDLE